MLLSIISLILVIAVCCIDVMQAMKIKELRTEVETYKNVAETAESMYDGLREKVEDESHEYRIIHAEYCTSDSDTMKYKTDAAMESAVKSRLSMLIANDIKSIAEPHVVPVELGRKKYSYVIKLKVL